MANKKAYFKPTCSITEILGRSLMISASGGDRSVSLGYDGEGNAGDGLSNSNDGLWDDED